MKAHRELLVLKAQQEHKVLLVQMELRVSRVFTEPMEHKAQLVQAHKVPQAQTVFRAYKVWAAQMAHKELPEQAHKVPQAVMVSRVYKASTSVFCQAASASRWRTRCCSRGFAASARATGMDGARICSGQSQVPPSGVT